MSVFDMAPKRGESIERTDEREEFMQSLAEYHEKRGYDDSIGRVAGPRMHLR